MFDNADGGEGGGDGHHASTRDLPQRWMLLPDAQGNVEKRYIKDVNHALSRRGLYTIFATLCIALLPDTHTRISHIAKHSRMHFQLNRIVD